MRNPLAQVNAGVGLAALATAALGLSCQLARTPSVLVLGILPSVDTAPPSEFAWSSMPGSRPTALFEHPYASEPLAAETEPGSEDPTALPHERVMWIKGILEERAASLTPEQRHQVAEELVRSEREEGIDAALLLALIEQESHFDPHARSSMGALGLMQVRPFVAQEVATQQGIPWSGPDTLRDPELNVRIGTRYFAEMKRMYRENTLALAAYNMGPYRVKRILARGEIPNPPYVFQVLERYRSLRRAP